MTFEFIGGPLDGEERDLPPNTLIFDIETPQPYMRGGAWPIDRGEPERLAGGRYRRRHPYLEMIWWGVRE